MPRMTLSTPVDSDSTLRFLRLLWRVNHAMERASSHMHATLGITAPQRMVIRFIGRAPGISSGELAEVLHVDPGTLSSTLRVLEREKLVARRADDRDRRRVRVFLTPRGRQLDADTPRTVEAAVRVTLSRQSKLGLSSIQRILEALARELGEIADGSPHG